MLTEIFNDEITSSVFDIPGSFTKREFVVKASATPHKLGFQAGFLHAYIDLIELDLNRVRTESKLILINQPHIIRFKELNFPFTLSFEKVKNHPSIQLKIYQRNMPIYSDPNIIIPSNNSSSATATTVPNSATSVALLAANANRKGFKITNNSNQDLFIEFGATASIAAFSVRLPKLPGSNIPAVYEGEGYTGAIAGIWQAAGTGGALVREFI